MLLNDEMSLNDRMTQWLTSVTLEIRFMTLNMFVGRNLPIVILGRPYSFYSAGVNEQLSSYLLTLITTDKNLHMTHSYTSFFIIRQRGEFNSISLVSIDSGRREDFSILRPRMGRKGRHDLSILRLPTVRGPRHDPGFKKNPIDILS